METKTPTKPLLTYQQYLASQHISKFTLITRIVFGMVVMFGLVGNMLRRGTMPVAIVVVTCVMWVACRVIDEALRAVDALLNLNKAPKEDK